jgi:hypothetical protein
LYFVVNCFKDSHHYPCSWVGKTFKVSEGNVSIGVWDFDFTGKGSMLDMLGEVLQLECVKWIRNIAYQEWSFDKEICLKIISGIA